MVSLLVAYVVSVDHVAYPKLLGVKNTPLKTIRNNSSKIRAMGQCCMARVLCYAWGSVERLMYQGEPSLEDLDRLFGHAYV